MTERQDQTGDGFIRVDVATHSASMETWLEAAVLDPKSMPAEQIVGIRPNDDASDDVIATLRLSENEYEWYRASMDGDESMIPSAIEATLDVIATEVLESAEIAKELLEIPVARASDTLGKLIAVWQVDEAVNIKRAIEEWASAYEGIRLERLSGGEGGRVRVAVTVPPEVSNAIEPRYGECVCGFCSREDALYVALEAIAVREMSKGQPLSEPRARGFDWDDDEIPF